MGGLKMKKHLKYTGLFLCLSLVVIVCGCSNSSRSSSTNKQTLSGVYKISNKDADKDDAGKSQPGYYYFKKNGKLLWAQADTGDGDQGNYGNAARGTWKSLGNNKFKIYMKYIYDNDEFTFTAKKSGNKLHTYSNSRKAKYEWDADNNYKQPDMTYSDFMTIFNNGKKSEQKKIQENGYDKPDNDAGNSNSSSNNDSEMTFDKAAQILQKGGFSDFDYDRDSQTHDGSHATSNGGYFMVTYPGAKGQDQYTITKVGKNKYHVKAVYGSSDGGFTPSPDQSSFGPTSADVTL